jgi:CYTH domain-containing protein
MATEIERKFLVRGDAWKNLGQPILYLQGYICREKRKIVRARLVGDKGYLTIKGASKGLSRLEFEYEIPSSDAREMLDKLCEKPIIEKYRRKITFGNLVWEVDEFLGDNEGLIIAEVELTREQQYIELPDWIDREVTGDKRYYNAYLVKHPYKSWWRK